MIITSPIPANMTPDYQLARGSLVTITRPVPPGQTLETLNAFGEDIFPESEYLYALFFKRSGSGTADTRLVMRPAGRPNGTRLYTFDFARTNAIALNDYFDYPKSEYNLILFPRSFGDIDRILFYALMTNPPSNFIDWAVLVKGVQVIRPTIPFKGSLRYERKTKKSITGRAFTTTQSPDKLFGMDITLKNEPRREVVDALSRLDELSSFAVWPMGVESVFLNHDDIEYRRFGFTRNMVVERFTGWSGYQGVDVQGASGRMRLVETVL